MNKGVKMFNVKSVIDKNEKFKDIITNITCIFLCFALSFIITKFILHKTEYMHNHFDLFPIIVFISSSFIVFSLETLIYLGVIINKSKKQK